MPMSSDTVLKFSYSILGTIFQKDTDSLEGVQRAGGQTGGCSGKAVT